MSKRLRPWRRFMLAAALSGAVHAATLFYGRLELPTDPEELPPLAVRVVRLQQEAPAVPAMSRATPRPPVAGIPIRQADRSVPAPAAQAGEVEAAPQETPPAEVAEVAQPAQPEPVVVATAPPSTFIPDAAAARSFPRRGRIAFNITYGRDGFPVGRTEQSWRIDGTRYQLSSRSETTGLIDLLRSQQRTYSSRGELTESGFRPDSFQMSRDRGGGRKPEEARARFDWRNATVTLGPPNAQRDQALPPGSQDLMSFMYQLALDPPPQGRLRLAVTNGTRLETYEFEVHPEERIETPLAVLRALPIRQVRTARAETIDIWLATEHRHLPVRIRFYGRDGEPAGEQVVTEIRLTED